jgi:hypothetical protein
VNMWSGPECPGKVGDRQDRSDRPSDFAVTQIFVWETTTQSRTR